MKILVAIVLCALCVSAQAFQCPNAPEDYRAEIATIRRQQVPLSEQLDQTADTATAIVLTNKSIALEERISAVLQRMYECDAIGKLKPEN